MNSRTTSDDVIVVTGNASGSRVLGLAAQVNITGAESANYRLVIKAGDDDDVMIGGDGNDDLTGGAGDDVLIGGPGLDVLDGGTGDNVVIQ